MKKIQAETSYNSKNQQVYSKLTYKNLIMHLTHHSLNAVNF